MSPRTKSPPPSYCPYDDFEYVDCQPGTSFRSTMSGYNSNSQYYSPRSTTSSGQSSSKSSSSSQSSSQSSYNGNNYQYFSTQQQSSVSPSLRTAATTTTTNTRNKENPKWFSSLSLNVPRRILSFPVVQTASLIVIYSFCISVVMIMFITSYILTCYDEARRTFRTSRLWAQIKSNVRDRATMLGENWEEFLQKYFDQSWDGVDVNRNGPLGGFNKKNNFNPSEKKNNNNNNNNNNSNFNSNNSNNNNNNNNNNNPSNNARDKEWEDWLKDTMFKFMTVVAGQEISNKFQNQTQTSFWTNPTTTTTTAGRK